MANDEINVPSLVLILVVSGLLLRHFFFHGPGPSSSSSSAAASGGARRSSAQDQRRAELLDRRIEAATEHILEVFPTADRRTVWWDLRRNGVNIELTAQRVESRQGLEVPPITFQPPVRPSRTAAASSSNGTVTGRGSTAAISAAAAKKSSQPDLIQRYHLQDRVVSSDAGVASEETIAPAAPSAPVPSFGNGSRSSKAWSSNRDERQALLKKRRDDMILEARRKMEAKLAAEKAAAEAGSRP